MARQISHQWQCVLVCWGTKYGAPLINNLVFHIRSLAEIPPTRVVLITDRSREDLDSGIDLVPMPAFWNQALFKGPGCQAKLCMFESGVVPDDLPALYVDLDSVVIGDLSRALLLLRQQDSVFLLQSAVIPFGRLGRLIYAISRGRFFARGNSSFVLFHPAHATHIADRFKALFNASGSISLRPMIADERFISWAAHKTVAAFPRDLFVKFTSEYMFYWPWWLYIRALLPWVVRRRKRQVAVTLNGPRIKPEALVSLNNGSRLTDPKGRVLVWSPRTLGRFREQLLRFYESQPDLIDSNVKAQTNEAPQERK